MVIQSKIYPDYAEVRGRRGHCGHRILCKHRPDRSCTAPPGAGLPLWHSLLGMNKYAFIVVCVTLLLIAHHVVQIPSPAKPLLGHDASRHSNGRTFGTIGRSLFLQALYFIGASTDGRYRIIEIDRVLPSDIPVHVDVPSGPVRPCIFEDLPEHEDGSPFIAHAPQHEPLRLREHEKSYSHDAVQRFINKVEIQVQMLGEQTDSPAEVFLVPLHGIVGKFPEPFACVRIVLQLVRSCPRICVQPVTWAAYQPACALVGVVRLPALHVVAIAEKREVGKIVGHRVDTVTRFELVPVYIDPRVS